MQGEWTYPTLMEYPRGECVFYTGKLPPGMGTGPDEPLYGVDHSQEIAHMNKLPTTCFLCDAPAECWWTDGGNRVLFKCSRRERGDSEISNRVRGERLSAMQKEGWSIHAGIAKSAGKVLCIIYVGDLRQCFEVDPSQVSLVQRSIGNAGCAACGREVRVATEEFLRMHDDSLVHEACVPPCDQCGNRVQPGQVSYDLLMQEGRLKTWHRECKPEAP